MPAAQPRGPDYRVARWSPILFTPSPGLVEGVRARADTPLVPLGRLSFNFGPMNGRIQTLSSGVPIKSV